jgi:putative endonuclease
MEIPPTFVTRANAQGCDIDSSATHISPWPVPVAGFGPATHVLVATAPLFAASGSMGGWIYILTNSVMVSCMSVLQWISLGACGNIGRVSRIGSQNAMAYVSLIYAEHHTNILSPKQREMNIKHWPRAWKIRLIH